MNKGSRLLELRPNRLLLDESFGSYKLSLDPIPIYRKTHDSGVRVIQPSDDQFSFYHVKIFSLHNHLHVNPFNPNSVYFVDKNCKILKVVSFPPHQSVAFKEVLQIPNTQQLPKDRYNISIAFPNASTAIVCDGSGALYLSEIIDQENNEVWKLKVAGDFFREEIGCIISDARIESDNERTLHVLLLFVEEKKEEKENGDNCKKDGLFQTKLKWRTFVEKGDIWEKKSSKELCINGSVDYVALEPGCKSFYMISDQSPKWIFDSEKPIECDVDMETVPQPKLYNWLQTSDEITIWLPVADNVTKFDFVISVDDLNLEIKVKGEIIISGKFFQRVSKNLTTWSFEENKLEMQLTKHESGLMWSCLIVDDERGEEIVEPELAKNIHEKLAHLCSDKQETGSATTLNTFQLEECDAVPCDTASLFRINGEDHVTTHEVSLSTLQWLFKVTCHPGQPPAICLRHDVDACVWQFSPPHHDPTWPHTHLGTFSAIGYVQASKTNKKFMASAPDLSYVAILEASHHIYIYRQPTPLHTQLKNRHTGKKVDTISKQQLVNLETKEQILGVHATNTFLFVLLENSLCVLTINI